MIDPAHAGHGTAVEVAFETLIRPTRAALTGSTVRLLTWSDWNATATSIRRFRATKGCIRRACLLVVGHGGGRRRAVSPAH
jgi:hypothetical protein